MDGIAPVDMYPHSAQARAAAAGLHENARGLRAYL